MKLRSIQLIRMIAALMIAFLHAIGTQVNPYHQPTPYGDRLLDCLSSGVDIFFVLSGFIIAFSAGRYAGGKESLLFVRKRFLRLNPLYYVATLFCLAVNGHHLFEQHLLPSPAAILNSIMPFPVADRTQFNGYILMVAWTLSFEWFFYLLFALAIAGRIRYKGPFLIALGLLLVACYYVFPIPDFRFKFVTNPIMLEFLLGIVIYEVFSRWSSPSTVVVIGLLAAGAAGYLYQFFGGPVYLPAPSLIADGTLSLHKFFSRGVPAAFLVAGCLFLERKGSLQWLWNNRPANLLGDASYSIYLTHYTVYNLCEAVTVRLGPVINTQLSVLLWFLIATIAGVACYKLVEMPLLHALGRSLRRVPVPG
jgi:exopolysaccharide production protein ExoZ